jgi:hypothetical protein
VNNVDRVHLKTLWRTRGSGGGGGGTVDAGDVTGLSEAIDDRVDSLLVAGSNITLTYNDGADTLTIAASGGGSVAAGDVVGLDEAIDDRMSSTFVAGDNVSLVYNDGANTITLSVNGWTSTTIDFGAGATDKSLFVADTTITADQPIGVIIKAQDSASNTADNHWVENLSVVAGNVQAGVGFTIYVKCNVGKAHGIYNLAWGHI